MQKIQDKVWHTNGMGTPPSFSGSKNSTRAPIPLILCHPYKKNDHHTGMLIPTKHYPSISSRSTNTSWELIWIKNFLQIRSSSEASSFDTRFSKRGYIICINTNLLQPGFLAKYFLTSTCKAASSPLCTEPRFQELAKFDAGKQSSATRSQHLRFISKRKAWRVARTTRGEPDLDNFTDITLMVPGKSKKEKEKKKTIK